MKWGDLPTKTILIKGLDSNDHPTPPLARHLPHNLGTHRRHCSVMAGYIREDVMLVKDTKSRIVYRVEPINEPPPLGNYWRGYRQRKLNDGTWKDDAWTNPILLRKTDCKEMC